MIRVKLLNDSELVINADLVETIESAPDTIVTLTTGRKLICRDSVDEVIKRATAYHSAIRASSPVKE